MRAELEAVLEGLAPPLSETQRRITEAALALFAERGFEATTTAAIAERARLTEKTLFKHFRGGKREVFAQAAGPALLQLLEPLVLDRLRSTLGAGHASLAEALGAVLRERAAFAREHPEVVKLLAQEFVLREAFREPFIAHWKAKILPVVTRLLEQARARGELRAVPGRAILRAVVSAGIAYALETTLLGQGEGDAEEELDALLDVLLHGILAPPRPPRGRVKRRPLRP